MSLSSIPSESDNGNQPLMLLHKIESGTVDPKSIGQADRRCLVECLQADGYSTAEMAHVLKISHRTIERDKMAIRESHAIQWDPKLVERMAGRLCYEAELAVQRIRKVTREKDVPPGVKIDGEHRCYLIIADSVARLQDIGYLPKAARRVEADVTHHVGDLRNFAALDVEIDSVLENGSPDPAARKRLLELKQMTLRGIVAEEVDQIASSAEEEGGADE